MDGVFIPGARITEAGYVFVPCVKSDGSLSEMLIPETRYKPVPATLTVFQAEKVSSFHEMNSRIVADTMDHIINHMMDQMGLAIIRHQLCTVEHSEEVNTYYFKDVTRQTIKTKIIFPIARKKE